MVLTRSIAVFGIFILVQPADAQSASSVKTNHAPIVDKDIVVIGSREKQAVEPEHAAEYVRNVSQVPVSGQYARWHDSVCPRVTGLDATTAKAFESRVKLIAKDVGVGTGLADCRPNLVIIFTLDGDVTLKEFEKKRFVFPDSICLEERRMIRIAKQPVRWWADTDIQGADGEPLASSPNPGLGNLNLPSTERTRYTNSYSSSMIQTKIRISISAAVVIVDVVASSGKKLLSIADYTAFMVLGRARPVLNIAIPTVARLFDDSCRTCNVLTAADRRYLISLYQLPANRPANVIRSALTSRVADAR